MLSKTSPSLHSQCPSLLQKAQWKLKDSWSLEKKGAARLWKGNAEHSECSESWWDNSENSGEGSSSLAFPCNQPPLVVSQVEQSLCSPLWVHKRIYFHHLQSSTGNLFPNADNFGYFTGSLLALEGLLTPHVKLLWRGRQHSYRKLWGAQPHPGWSSNNIMIWILFSLQDSHIFQHRTGEWRDFLFLLFLSTFASAVWAVGV